MINAIKIKNFKSIQELSIPISNLTVLTGTNSVGKSSVLQALLVIRQSYYRGNFTNPIENTSLLLGDETTLVRVGNFKDVFNENAPKDECIGIAISFGVESKFQFLTTGYNNGNPELTFIDGFVTGLEDAKENPIFSTSFQYLSADRLPAQESYPNPQSNISFLGTKGEFTPFFIEKYGNTKIPILGIIPDVFEDKQKNAALVIQINYWLQKISAGVEVHTRANTANNKTELFYRYAPNNVPTGDRKPQNVGFGLTYTLPIIVALLSAPKDGLILIENPEAHLHAYGQSKLSELICIAAQAGVQILVETHSDHIINGIFIACKKKALNRENVNIYYFDKDEEQFRTRATSIEILDGGRTKNLPAGFFDQIGKDLRVLMSTSKPTKNG
jgi:predicted ATPase